MSTFTIPSTLPPYTDPRIERLVALDTPVTLRVSFGTLRNAHRELRQSQDEYTDRGDMAMATVYWHRVLNVTKLINDEKDAKTLRLRRTVKGLKVL